MLYFGSWLAERSPDLFAEVAERMTSGSIALSAKDGAVVASSPEFKTKFGPFLVFYRS